MPFLAKHGNDLSSCIKKGSSTVLPIFVNLAIDLLQACSVARWRFLPKSTAQA